MAATKTPPSFTRGRLSSTNTRISATALATATSNDCRIQMIKERTLLPSPFSLYCVHTKKQQYQPPLAPPPLAPEPLSRRCDELSLSCFQSTYFSHTAQIPLPTLASDLRPTSPGLTWRSQPTSFIQPVLLSSELPVSASTSLRCRMCIGNQGGVNGSGITAFPASVQKPTSLICGSLPAASAREAITSTLFNPRWRATSSTKRQRFWRESSSVTCKSHFLDGVVSRQAQKVLAGLQMGAIAMNMIVNLQKENPGVLVLGARTMTQEFLKTSRALLANWGGL